MAERITHERAREIATKTGTIYWDGFETRELLDYIEQQERAASPPAIPPDSELARYVDLSVELDRLLGEALELIEEYRCQWGDDYIAKKYGWPEEETKLRAKVEALRERVTR